MLAFGCDFLEGRDWLWLIPVLSKVGIWLQRKDSIVLAKQMDRSIVHNKRMADMLRCRESWIVKHVRKVHLPKPSWHPQSIPRLLPPTTESSPQSCLTLYLSYWVILAQFLLGPHWARFSICWQTVLKLISPANFKWKGQQSLCIPTTYAQKWVPSQSAGGSDSWARPWGKTWQGEEKSGNENRL